MTATTRPRPVPARPEEAPVTADLVVLCRSRPEAAAQVAALQAAGPQLRVATWQDTPVLLLLDDDGELVLAVDGARLVQVPGEVRRLLGSGAPDLGEAVWWVEVRASSTLDGAAAAARRLADVLVERHGGAVWSGSVVPALVRNDQVRA